MLPRDFQQTSTVSGCLAVWVYRALCTADMRSLMYDMHLVFNSATYISVLSLTRRVAATRAPRISVVLAFHSCVPQNLG